jgi:hypothetical protein
MKPVLTQVAYPLWSTLLGESFLFPQDMLDHEKSLGQWVGRYYGRPSTMSTLELLSPIRPVREAIMDRLVLKLNFFH